MSVSIYDVLDSPIEETVDFVRSNIPSNEHLLLTKQELWLLALQMLDNRGELDSNSSFILNTPLFGETFISERGDIGLTLARLGIDLLPGISLIRYL